MNPDNTVEYNSLSWVKAQLDDVLSDAQSNLNEYIENQTDEHLENCIEHLQLIYGTLQMVEVYGASMLAEEMQKTTAALLAGNVDRNEDTYDVLMRAMLQLPDYLEGIQAGNKDIPIILMPLINDLRAARKEGLLTESVLFSPDLESATLNSTAYDASAIEPGKLQAEVKRLRTHYQLGLLDFIRNNKQQVGLQRIKAVLNALEKVSSNAEVRRLWMVISALVEGIIKDGVSTNLSIKMLLGAVDRQLKLILDDGEEEFAKEYSKESIKNILYYVGSCTVETEAIAAVKDAYKLADLIPQESDDSSGLVGGLNADLFDTVSKGITEDLEQVKDILELFMHSTEQDLEQLIPVAEQLGKIADTYGMLSMGATRQSIMDQRVVLESIINNDVEVSEKLVLGIASELLTAESELKNYIAARSGFVDMNRTPGEEQAVPAAEFRQVVFTVVSEGLKNFSEAKEAILSYVSGIGEREQLETILQKIEEVQGVAMMLPLGRVEAQIEKLQDYVRVALLNNNHKVDEKEQDTIADVVTSIEYFLEALAEGRPGIEQGLNAGDDAAEILTEITKRFENITIDAEENGSEEVVTISNEAVSTEDALKGIAVSESVPETQSTVTFDAEQYAILADEADEEIVEIFIEEAIEVLGELHTYYPQWKSDTDDDEAMAVVRRSFHTLKGSGRLLGADLIGEFSWKFENMLNRIIDKKINVSDKVFLALDEALAVLPQLIEQLKGNREPIDNIAQLMEFTDAVAEGKDVSYQTESIGAGEVKETSDLNNESVSAVEEDIVEEESLSEVTDIDLQPADQEVEQVEPEIEFIDVSDSSQSIEIDEEISISDTMDTLEVVESDISFDAPDVEEDTNDTDIVKIDIEESSSNDELISFDDVTSDVDDLEDTIDLSAIDDVADDDEYEIVIDEGENTARALDGVLDIDPMLLQIYCDESKGHLESIKQQLDESESIGKPLRADTSLIRAFHTLYGSARTAEVEAIADLSGATE